ncbi:hypothetical protein TD95_002443 [Thielaviopsis punctulata]|uniref:DUF7582 domain-containing protein n=1 Tax=Thielaviopsis punctulata TaxID=72032 RepID=A0A0F4Z8K3_9PEZI|nr:hypothetical protein TD95_002443 [Thielaviopsis punctulata]
MVVSKLRISSPLEAGRSILDAYNLPPKLCDALDHVSSKLSSKGVNVKLAVALRDYQLPTLTIIPSDIHSSGVYASQPSTPGSPPPAPASATSSRFGFSSAISGLRQRLAGHLPTNLPLNSSSTSVSGSALTSPTNSAPYTPMTPMSPPPMSACTSTTFTTATDYTSPHGPCILGIRLIQTQKLDAKTSRTLHHVINKARVKFGIGQDMLPHIAAPDACGLTESIIRRSINQDEQLYTSKGLTLISLDRCYTFKSALSSYSRTGSPMRLEDAVDELRRLYLANGGRKVSRTDVWRSYDWLSVSKEAMADVDMMYRRAYGGAEGFGAIEGISSTPPEVDVSTASQTSLPHRFGRLDLSERMACRAWLDTDKFLEAELEKDIESNQNMESSRLWTEESESEDEYNLPSWEEKDEVVHVFDSRTATPLLKRNSTPRPNNSAATEKRVMLPKLQTHFPQSPERHARAGVKANRVVAHALDIVETPCTAHPINNTGALPFSGPAAPRGFTLSPAADHQNHIPSPTSAIARTFYGLPSGSTGTLAIPPPADTAPGSNLGMPSGAPYLAWPPHPSIAQLLSPTDSNVSISTTGGPGLGPMTPNGADDISPITRGEWGHLFAGSAFFNARTVAVTTCQDM